MPHTEGERLLRYHNGGRLFVVVVFDFIRCFDDLRDQPYIFMHYSWPLLLVSKTNLVRSCQHYAIDTTKKSFSSLLYKRAASSIKLWRNLFMYSIDCIYIYLLDKRFRLNSDLLCG